VTLHLMVAPPDYSRVCQVALMFWFETESILAEAVLIATASRSVAMSAVRPSFADVRIDCLSDGANDGWRARNLCGRANGVANATLRDPSRPGVGPVQRVLLVRNPPFPVCDPAPSGSGAGRQPQILAVAHPDSSTQKNGVKGQTLVRDSAGSCPYRRDQL